jgi:hypothetical protein
MEILCKSYNCIYNNQEGGCTANRIKVIGIDAQTSTGTSCDTFSFQQDIYTFEFARELFFENNERTTTQVIDCQANNCKFNSNGRCRADFVRIDNIHSRCQTFEPENFRD